MKTFLFILCLCNQLSAQEPSMYSMLITEIMADPLPPVSLPAYEYIELHNVSDDSVDLFGWKIAAGNSSASVNKHLFVAPQAYVIICGTSAASAFQSYGVVIGVPNFPALDNQGEILQLISPQNKTIHAVHFSHYWYGSTIKQQGGWSLEMINTDLPCGGSSNWKASSHPAGGTPGSMNSHHEISVDDIPPSLLRAYTIDSTHIVAVFDEPLNSADAANARNYILDHSADVLYAVPVAPLNNEVKLTLANPLRRQLVYRLVVNNIRDCHGNEIGSFNQTQAGLPDTVDEFDLVINEILFNPPSGGSDYIEIYNRSSKMIDLIDLFIASKNINGQLVHIYRIHHTPMILFPGQFFVMTENSIWIIKQYHVKQPNQLFQLSSIPPLADDKGTVALVTNTGLLIDEVAYNEKWHFPLLVNAEGVSLERISYDASSQSASNWSSASSTSGYGTPTYHNSQLITQGTGEGQFQIDPPVFSPNQDGWQDFLFIHFNLEAAGYMGTITIYNVNGILVRTLINNISLSSQGSFRWDGLDNNNQKLPAGIYIVSMDVFNLSGKRKKFKKAVTLAIRFK